MGPQRLQRGLARTAHIDFCVTSRRDDLRAEQLQPCPQSIVTEVAALTEDWMSRLCGLLV